MVKQRSVMVWLALCLLVLLTVWQNAAATTPQSDSPISFYLPIISNPSYELSLELVVGSIALPTKIAHAGDERLFVAQKQGIIRVIVEGELLPAPFLDITHKVLAAGFEQGLESLAFAPDYASSGYFYVLYTNLDGDVHLSRFQVSSHDPNIADPDSEQIVLHVPQPSAIHNGADLAFGPADGYLYMGLGDGGPQGDPSQAGQDRQTLLGKILRLDVTGVTTYTIPADNPFVDDPEARGEIWALGLRNPWRMSFDRETHDLWFGDVGENRWEEVNFQPADSPGGLNYGWRCYEGVEVYILTDCLPLSAFTFPVHAYFHHAPPGYCSITGGYVYRGTAITHWVGSYLFSDFCTGTIWGLRGQPGQWQVVVLLESPARVTSFGEDIHGELYVTDMWGVRIYRLVPFALPGG